MVSRTNGGSGVAKPRTAAKKADGATEPHPDTPADAHDKAGATRDTLLASAARLFAANGYAGTAVTDIAEDAGTSVGLLYYHFNSKLGLYGALYEEYQARQEIRAHEVAAEAKASGADSRTRVLMVIRSYLEGVLAERELGRIWYMHDTPSGFEEIRERASGHWTKRNFRVAAEWGDEGHAVVVFINSSISVLPREIVAARSQREARELIDSSIRVYARVLSSR